MPAEDYALALEKDNIQKTIPKRRRDPVRAHTAGTSSAVMPLQVQFTCICARCVMLTTYRASV